MTDADTAVEAPRPLRKDAARNRALLVEAGRAVFAERGLDASLDDIARHAGLGVGTAYRHFTNKYELAQAIFSEAIEEIVALADRALIADDPWGGLVLFLEGAAAAQTADRGLREVMMGVYDPSKMEEVNERISAPLRELVARAHAEGTLREDVEMTDIGVLILMLCTVADVTGDDAPDLWRRYLPMLLAGLRADVDLPVAPMTEEAFRATMACHKQRHALANRS